MIDVRHIKVCIYIESILPDTFSVLNPLNRIWDFFMLSKLSLKLKIMSLH